MHAFRRIINLFREYKIKKYFSNLIGKELYEHIRDLDPDFSIMCDSSRIIRLKDYELDEVKGIRNELNHEEERIFQRVYENYKESLDNLFRNF